MINLEDNSTFTCNLKKEIVTKKLPLNLKKSLLSGYFLNNYFPIDDNGKVKLVIFNIYPFVLEYIERCIQGLNLKLKFDRNDQEIKLGKPTYYLKIYGPDLELFEQAIGLTQPIEVSNNLPVEQAFLTGAFLAGGSMNNPENQHHFEIRCSNQEVGEALIQILAKFNINSLTTYHKNKFVVYLKKLASISDVLKIMNCNDSMMELEMNLIENSRHQSVARSTQLEIANLAKTVASSSRQIKQIMVIKNTPYWNQFSKIEQQCYLIRLENEEYSLAEIAKELSSLFDKNISRSSVQNYFNKLEKIYNLMNTN